MIQTLNNYLASVQRLLRDTDQSLENPEDLINYINRARREVAMRAQCIRVLPPTSSSIVGWTVQTGGTGYSSAPTCAITSPDYPSGKLPYPNGKQALATAIVQAGVIVAIESQFGGSGYFNPIMTITDPSGKGATATPVLQGLTLLNQAQEQYNFSDVDLSQFPGVDSIFNVRSVSIIYANYRYSLPKYAFTIYQAYIRQYPFQYQYVPTFFTQFGQGAGGSLFFYPLPSQTYQMELDCLCLPSDLQTNNDYEALPAPWTDAVAYFAVKLAYEELQNLNAANYYQMQFDKYLLGYSQAARIGGPTNVYGRY